MTHRPRDIVIFTSYVPLFNHEGMKKFIREIISEFPDRKIYIQLKSFFHDNEIANRFIKDCIAGFENAQYSPLFLEDFIDSVGYAFSDPATIAVETIQFGIPTFVIDVVEKHEYCIYREYPHLCHSNSENAVSLIRNIEDGSWEYPFESYNELVEMSGGSIFDQIKSDMNICVETAELKHP